MLKNHNIYHSLISFDDRKLILMRSQSYTLFIKFKETLEQEQKHGGLFVFFSIRLWVILLYKEHSKH